VSFFPPAQRNLEILFAGVGAVLVVSSLVGGLLKWRLAPGRPHAVLDNLNARIRAWWVMAAVIGAAVWTGRAGAIALFALVSFVGLREIVTLSPTRRGDHVALVVAFVVVLPAQSLLVAEGWFSMFAIFIPVYVFLLLPVISALSFDTKDFLSRSAVLQWGLMIAVYAVSHVPALLDLRIAGYEGRNVELILFFLIVVQASDVLQYVWGKLLGRNKVAPELSPSKTVEGFIGGVLSAALLGMALWRFTPFRPWQAGAIALVVVLMGFFGGLVMSAIKRDRGVKDWGAMIEGHGGMLDRVDSICFAAPIFFHVVRYWWT